MTGNTNSKYTRQALSNMTEEDQREVAKAFSTTVLAEELYARVKFYEDQNKAMKEIATCRR